MGNLVCTGRGIFGNRPHAPYDLLARLEPGLMLDIGASNGNFTKLMLAKSPKSRVLAFEPYPGNLPILHKTLDGLPAATIIEKAVSDDHSDMPFFVSSKVTSGAGHWGTGYSSLGYIVRGEKSDESRTVMVPTISVDEAIGDQRVRFMKVDVQGGELSVLRSAKKALEDQRIEIMHLEYSGEKDVLDTVFSYGYIVFDSQYVLIPLTEQADFSKWDLVEPLKLSTGKLAQRAWPRAMPTSQEGYVEFLTTERRKIGNAFTDLVCVSRGALPSFLTAAMASL